MHTIREELFLLMLTLNVDGGGVRGVSSLCILKDIMSKISDDKDIKPCDYFDMMMGTSTGGFVPELTPSEEPFR